MLCLSLPADQVTMSNGDRYVGRVISLNGDTVVLESDVLGTVRLPRGRVASISLEQRPAGRLSAVRATVRGGIVAARRARLSERDKLA